MSDISALIMNQIRAALNALHNSGVGYIDAETSDTFDYKVDGRTFSISIEEETAGKGAEEAYPGTIRYCGMGGRLVEEIDEDKFESQMREQEDSEMQ